MQFKSRILGSVVGASFVLSLSLSFGANAHAEAFFLPAWPAPAEDQTAPKKTAEQHWKDAGLKFRRVEWFANSLNCYQTKDKFTGCLSALNNALAVLSEKSALVPQGYLSSVEGKFTKGPAFGGLQVITFEKSIDAETAEEDDNKDNNKDEKKPLSQIVAELKARRKAQADAVAALFTATTPKIQIESITGWLRATYVDKGADKESLATGAAMNAYLSAVKDPHSDVVPLSIWEDMDPEAEAGFFGIGARLRLVEKKLIIENPMRGSPALAAGIKSKDQIVKIDGKDVPAKIDEAVKLIKGPKGTSVTLTIRRAGSTKDLDITIVRDQIVIKNVSYQMEKNAGVNVGHITLASFGLNPKTTKVCSEIRAAITDLTAQKAQGLVLDLRDNGGGLLSDAACVNGIFVGKDKVTVIARYVYPGLSPEATFSTGDQATDLPLVVLVNGNSASASEIVSGGLQDYSRAVIVGERTFGKGTVQTGFQFHNVPRQINSPFSPSETMAKISVAEWTDELENPPKLLLKLTIQRFYLPRNWTNQLIGVQPDVETYRVPNPTEDDKFAFREDDAYSNSLPAVGERPASPRPAYIAKIQNCVKTEGKAEKNYVAMQNDAIAPDFQMLTAEDTIRCMTK